MIIIIQPLVYIYYTHTLVDDSILTDVIGIGVLGQDTATEKTSQKTATARRSNTTNTLIDLLVLVVTVVFTVGVGFFVLVSTMFVVLTGSSRDSGSKESNGKDSRELHFSSSSSSLDVVKECI